MKIFVKRVKSISLLFFVLFAWTVSSMAADDTGGQGITISPPILEFDATPGTQTTKIIKINNPTASLVEFYPQAMNFKAKGENGEPDFYTEEESGNVSTYGLASWIKFSEDKISIAPNVEKQFQFQMSIPTSAEPGGHYGVVFFSTEAPKTEAQKDAAKVYLSSKVGTLILAKVPGKITESASLKQFSAKKLYFKPPVDFVIKVANTGNVHIKPTGNLTLKSMFGSEADKLVINEKKGAILPDSTRAFNTKWQSKGKYFFEKPFGRVTADLGLIYGENQTALNGQLNFWLIPYWLLTLIALLLLIIILFLIIHLRRRGAKIQIPQNTVIN